MGKLKTSKRAKDNYTLYKNTNKVLKNKIAKLTKYCKEFPNDKLAKENLARIKKDGYKPRSKPLTPGSNPTTPKIRLSNEMGHLFGPKTAGEQLSKLLGIPIPKQRSHRKPKVTHKQRRNVRA